VNLLSRIIGKLGAITTPSAAYQMCHVLLAYSMIVTMGPPHKWWLVSFISLLSAVKEFWYDMHYETPEVSGGWKGGLLDFSFYQVGIILSLIRFLL